MSAPHHVTLYSYLGLPVIAGAVAVLLFLLSLLLIRTYNWEGRKQWLGNADWWGHPISGSGAWTVNDSWATNISTGLVVVSTILATLSATTTGAFFPGIAPDRFAVVFIVAGVIVAAAPVAFGICYSLFTTRNPGLAADSTVLLSSGQTVTVSVPSGASITMTADAVVQDAAQRATVRAGCAYQIPPGAEIAIQQGAVPIARVIRKAIADIETGGRPVIETVTERATADVAAQCAAEAAPAISFSGTSDIGTMPGTTVTLNVGASEWTIGGGDLVAANGQAANPPPDVRVSFPARVIANGGTKITVTGAADLKLPADAVISGPRRKNSSVRKDRWFQVPQGSDVIVANLAMLVVANVITMFGIGAELGVAFVLANFSSATGGWLDVLYAALGVLSVLLLGYAYAATVAMANPQPGSATSAQAGTSFTL